MMSVGFYQRQNDTFICFNLPWAPQRREVAFWDHQREGKQPKRLQNSNQQQERATNQTSSGAVLSSAPLIDTTRNHPPHCSISNPRHPLHPAQSQSSPGRPRTASDGLVFSLKMLVRTAAVAFPEIRHAWPLVSCSYADFFEIFIPASHTKKKKKENSRWICFSGWGKH